MSYNSTIIVGCNTIKHELQMAMEDTGCAYPVILLESGLHSNPDKLREALQNTFDGIDDADTVLMAFGYCGNSIAGVKTGGFRMIMPRADDCITLLLGSIKTRTAIMKEQGTYFLTKGWLEGERNIWSEYDHYIKRYGERRAKIIYKAMLAHYTRLGILDTGAYEVSEIEEETKHIADTLGLTHQVLPATRSYIEQLITGPWEDSRFLVVPPYTVVLEKDLFKLG